MTNLRPAATDRTQQIELFKQQLHQLKNRSAKNRDGERLYPITGWW
ncbi:MAG: hypothetical protein F6K56_26025 [Moorea sp. SIO3G5]|nr:hypothetical protein [Moorena sp. SIO3G5]